MQTTMAEDWLHTDDAEAMARLESVAMTLRALPPFCSDYIHISLGCGAEPCIALERLGGKRHIYFYDDDTATAIEAVSLTIRGISFAAQMPRRPQTDVERAARAVR